MKNLNQILNYLILLVVISVGAAYYFLHDKAGFNSVVTSSAGSQDKTKVEQVVNKYMRQVGDQAKLTEIRARRELEELQKKVELEKLKQIAEDEKKLQDMPIENQIYKSGSSDSGAEAMNADAAVGVDAAVSERPVAVNAEGEIDVKSMTPEQKSEYIRQYKENARRGGYLIELNDNLEVIKATPIRKPSQQNDAIEAFPND